MAASRRPKSRDLAQSSGTSGPAQRRPRWRRRTAPRPSGQSAGRIHRLLVAERREESARGDRSLRADRRLALVVKVALDTNAYTALMRGHREVANRVRRAEKVIISTVVAGE